MALQTKLLIIIVAVCCIGALLVATRSDRAGGFRAAFDAEFLARPDGYHGLTEAYGLVFNVKPLQMEPGLMYRALKDKAVHLIDGFSTDGRIPAYNLITLEDDKGFFPPYYAAPIIRRDTLERHPELEHILNVLAGRITSEAMQLLNYRVDKKGERATDVAFDFLVAEGLINTDAPAQPPAGNSIAVGGKHFTEQEILGEIIALLIEHASAIPVTRYLNLGGTIICFNALQAGDIDIYAEYTGTGLINILGREMLSDPEKVYDLVREEFSRHFDLIWLKPFGFNNTYTLTMRKDVAHSLGIQSISDLAAYLAR